MTSVKEIYQWYERIPQLPEMPSSTSIQLEKWQNHNSKQIEKTFEGEFLTASPATILDIDADKVTAYADYKLDYIIFSHPGHEGEHYRTLKQDGTPLHVTPHIQVQYRIEYDKSIFFETLSRIQRACMVELEGEIIKARREFYGGRPTNVIHIEMRLTKINEIESRFLHAELLDDQLRFRRPPIMSNCFVVTAAFGDQSAPEVIRLRQFRDEVLVNYTVGMFLVNVYGLVGPPIANLIKESPGLRTVARSFVRGIVLPVIRRISCR